MKFISKLFGKSTAAPVAEDEFNEEIANLQEILDEKDEQIDALTEALGLYYHNTQAQLNNLQVMGASLLMLTGGGEVFVPQEVVNDLLEREWHLDIQPAEGGATVKIVDGPKVEVAE